MSDISKIKKQKIIRRAFYALLVAAAVAAGASAYFNNDDYKVESISQFLRDVDAHKIKKVAVSSDYLNESMTVYSVDPSRKPYKVTSPRFGIETATSLAKEGIEVTYPKAEVNLGNVANHLMTLMLIAYMGFMLLQFMPGGLSLKLNKKPKETKKFDDVAGAEEAKAAMVDVVDYLKNPKEYERWGAKFPSGIILCGPPGNGKTLLARAVAGEAGAEFITASPSDFTSPFIGVAGMKINRLFSRARSKAPCVIFIDEIDSIGGARMTEGSAAAREMGSTLTQLLVQLDGFEPNSGVIVIAATNRVESLDPALLRSGRFDRHIKVDAPSVNERKQILEIHGRTLPLSKDFSFDSVAKATIGLSGADLANLMNQAALIAKKSNSADVKTEHAISSRDRMLMGEQRQSLRAVLDENTRETLAYHEASHAVVAAACGPDLVTSVSIMPRSTSLGQTIATPTTDRVLPSESFLHSQLRILAAGRQGEMLFCGGCTTGASNDIERMGAIVSDMVCKLGMSRLGMVIVDPKLDTLQSRRAAEESMRIIQQVEQDARVMLRDNEGIVEELKAYLLEHEDMSGEPLEMILARIKKYVPPAFNLQRC